MASRSPEAAPHRARATFALASPCHRGLDLHRPSSWKIVRAHGCRRPVTLGTAPVYDTCSTLLYVGLANARFAPLRIGVLGAILARNIFVQAFVRAWKRRIAFRNPIGATMSVGSMLTGSSNAQMLKTVRRRLCICSTRPCQCVPAASERANAAQRLQTQKQHGGTRSGREAQLRRAQGCIFSMTTANMRMMGPCTASPEPSPVVHAERAARDRRCGVWQDGSSAYVRVRCSVNPYPHPRTSAAQNWARASSLTAS
ncbi:hypothetical protein C8Q76DRAFT_342450 [Earliella scabrosa]|nr:hypothetical protein C8Q76DRAFT_342450 [Earliella scabrosa]